MSQKILHIRTGLYGIAYYGELIEAIYRLQGIEVEPVIVGPQGLDANALANREGVYHFELGSGDYETFRLSRTLLEKTGRPQMVTLHDPGVVVRNAIEVPGTASALAPVRLLAKVARRSINRLLGRQLLASYLHDSRIHKLVLRPDLVQDNHSYYLPHPTYHEQMLGSPDKQQKMPRIGYVGFWGYGRGMETLLEATKLLRQSGALKFKLVLGGGAAGKDGGYAERMRGAAQLADAGVEMPGFIEQDDMENFLQGLAALVLPYWPELPNGTSGMAMRAAELGVPIIASDTMALKGQLGEDGAVYVQPKDAAALAGVIRELLADPAAARERARQTQAKIFAEHNWSVVGAKLKELVAVMEKAS